MKKILVMMFLGFLVMGLVFNFPIVLAHDSDEHHGNSLLTGSATDENPDRAPTLYAKQKIRAQVNSDGRIRIRDKDGEEVESEVEFEGNEDNLSVLTSDGKRHRIKINPERAKERIHERWNSTFNISDISLEEVKHKNIPRVVYKLQSDHPGKFLGIFKMALKVQSQVDPETGEILAVNLPWWAFLLSDLEIPDDVLDKINNTDDDEKETEVEVENETEDNETNSTA